MNICILGFGTFFSFVVVDDCSLLSLVLQLASLRATKQSFVIQLQ